MQHVRHLVVLMLENRSFDNMLGYVYAGQNNRPPINIPAPVNGQQPTYEGLLNPGPGTDFWNPKNEDYFTGAQQQPAYATARATDFRMPNPDPEEQFDHMTYQLFGPPLNNPAPNAPHQMKGFYLDYESATKKPGINVMECYASDQVPVITALAREYAVCDHWYASSPTQTWPNRAFVHLGTSRGMVNNWPNDPYHYDIDTIFNVLGEISFTPWGQRVEWGVYSDSVLPSLTRLQLPRLWDPLLEGHFHSFDHFKQNARDGALPSYSFIEPSFVIDPNDEHPPHDVRLGERFIFDVWNAVVTGKKWNETLLLITYDEHGGCYDHVSPPFGATAPDETSNPGELGFRFNRFGVRVPAILISPYIQAGTVFRSAGTPYDHTSILATLREWLQIPTAKMLPSERIKAAPTFSNILTLDNPRKDLPDVKVREDSLQAFRILPEEPPNDLQKSMMIAIETKRVGRPLAAHEREELLEKMTTRGQMLSYLKIKG